MPTELDNSEIDYQYLKRVLSNGNYDKELFDLVVNLPFQYKKQTAELFLGIIVLLLVNKETGTIDRVALSDTELAKNTLKVSMIPFENIKIGINHTKNIIALAIKSGVPQGTIDWKTLFTPAMTPAAARINQASAGIAYSAVYPIKSRDGGALIFSYYQYKEEIGSPQENFMNKYTKIVSRCLNLKRQE